MPKEEIDSASYGSVRNREQLADEMAVDEAPARSETKTEIQKAVTHWQRSHSAADELWEIEMKQPLTAVLKTKDLEIVQECEIPLEQFPDMIELTDYSRPPTAHVRQFFRIAVTDRCAIYREGTSYRISQ